MAKRAQVDLSKVVKKATPLNTLVARDLEKQRGKFNLTDEQIERLGRRSVASTK